MAKTEKRPIDAPDATTTPPTKKARKPANAGISGLPQSEHPGVRWDKATGKWRGAIQDKLKRTASGGKKFEHTKYFTDEAECIEATKALRAKLDAEFEETVTKWANEDPRTKGLERAPDDWTQAKEGVVYWTTNPKNGHKPYRALRPAGVKKDGSVQWPRACNHESGCHKRAKQAVPGGPAEFCMDHGGKCPHGRQWQVCQNCNPNVTKGSRNCSNCGQELGPKRRECHGGNKLCVHCETHFKAEAAANGSVAPPPKGKRWEDVVFDKLTTLVVDKEGRVIQYDMRDDHKSMLGSNKRRNKNECDTDHQRRPDLLYLVRDEDARIVAALLVEVDENSHTDRESACEAGKVDETFQSILALAQQEGKARLAVVRKGEVLTPYVKFLKINPNACDKAATGGGTINLDTRIAVLARMCNKFLNRSPKIYKKWSRKDRCMTPVVQCLYYHTKQGGKHLAYFKKRGGETKAWKWLGNKCPKE